VAKDEAEAVKWWRKAAEQGMANAQYNLGVCCANGHGVAKDNAEAVNWYRKAAEQNDTLAQYNLGFCYYKGVGVAKNAVQVYKWWLLAGAQGYEDAKEGMTMLEHLLTRAQLAKGQKLAGDFNPPEVPSLDDQPGEADGQALADLRARAATGNAQAQNELGEALYAGKRGVVKNPVEAVKWYRRAAEQNHAKAQCNLGVCYERGDGVAKYELEAYKWDQLAAAQGDTKAKHNASILELMLSPEQITEGKRRAQGWLEQRKKASAVGR
jgi:TPR repeat protein